MKKTKGFTLIELLIVIAIIGILSAIVLASLNTARAKGVNAAIKSTMSGVRSQAEIIYSENNGVYTAALCTDTKIRELLDSAGVKAIDDPTAALCNSDDLYWVAQSPLKIADNDGNTYWCIDYNGAAKGETVVLDPGATECA